ncbi:MAG TPA: hypothetical protein VIR33_15280 [Thermopolyspora sp.]|jgi:hypothetical protein
MNLTDSFARMPYVYEDLVRERQRALHQEAQSQHLAGRIRSVQKARRRVERANLSLQRALARV